MTVLAGPTGLADRYRLETGSLQLTGVQALVRLPFEVLRADRRAGRRTSAFVSGYEGSPLAGYDLELARNRDLIEETGLVFRPAVNEELAATAVEGTQLASVSPDRTVEGVVGFWYGKSPGVDRASDALRHANLMGTAPDGGAVALVGDDPAAKSSTVPGASEALLADLGLPVLYPADPQEALDLGMHAVALSRSCGLWVAMKIATNVADGFQTVSVAPDRVVPVIPPSAVAHQVSAKLLQPVIGRLEESREGARLAAARDYAALNGLNRILDARPGQRIGIVAAGKTFLDVRRALEVLGADDVRLLQLGMIHPIEPTIVRSFAEGLEEIIVVEEKRPFLEVALKDVLYDVRNPPAVRGRQLFPRHGELDADKVARGLAPTFGASFPQPERVNLPVVSRTPYFCSGCPHNRSTRTPEGSLVGAGIGCHAMVTLMEPERVGEVTGLTQMGGEGAQWIGMQPFVAQNHLLQNLGDGTFHHSGSLALRAAVAGGVNITYKLLYNSAVAMTGGQQPAGGMPVPRIAAALLAEGVRRVVVTTEDPRRYRGVRLPSGVKVRHRDRLIEVQESLARVPGVTVLIHDQECASELRRKRKRGLAVEPTETVVINERVCEGCGDCGQKSNCLSVQPVPTEFGRKTRIDQSSCNKDYSCLAGDCPAFMTVSSAAKPSVDLPDFPDLPEPPAGRKAATIRITGVGGSGVVTLAQTLGQAATLAGLSVRAVDQTGLAQKGGAVVSDLRISATDQAGAHRVGAGECDLYLVCDLLVGAGQQYLAAADPARTTAVVSTAKVPTGRMVVDPSVAYPDDSATVDKIRASVRPEGLFLDARAVALARLGDEQYANVLLAGAAYQLGAVPIPAEHIEAALRLNGVRVDANIAAFRLGRSLVVSPAAAEPVAPPAVPGPARIVRAEEGSELARLTAIRIPELVAYQDAAYARRYADVVERVRRAETAAVPGATALTEAAAWSLHKLMAYKDEYEVARLLLLPTPGVEHVSYRLHPPVLRALGMRSKISLGPWSKPALRALQAGRRLRGTRLDPFGRTPVRRVERALVDEFIDALDRVCDSLTPRTHAAAVELAGLPDLVRGYEQVKLANVARYRDRLSELLP